MKTIRVFEKVALVENDDGTIRRVVPVEEKDNPEAFEVGMPWGVPWEMLELSASAEVLAVELRRRGIWTAEDLRANPKVAMGALQATYGLDVAKLSQFAAKFKEVA